MALVEVALRVERHSLGVLLGLKWWVGLSSVVVAKLGWPVGFRPRDDPERIENQEEYNSSELLHLEA